MLIAFLYDCLGTEYFRICDTNNKRWIFHIFWKHSCYGKYYSREIIPLSRLCHFIKIQKGERVWQSMTRCSVSFVKHCKGGEVNITKDIVTLFWMTPYNLYDRFLLLMPLNIFFEGNWSIVETGNLTIYSHDQHRLEYRDTSWNSLTLDRLENRGRA